MSEIKIGQPNLTIDVRTAANQVVTRLKAGVVAIFVRDVAIQAVEVIVTKRASSIPAMLSESVVSYISRAYVGGYLGEPSKVLLVMTPPELEASAHFTAALEALRLYDADYIVAPLDATSEELTQLQAWIDAQRLVYRPYKAVLPNVAGDNRGIINCVMDGTVTSKATLSAIEMRSEERRVGKEC